MFLYLLAITFMLFDSLFVKMGTLTQFSGQEQTVMPDVKGNLHPKTDLAKAPVP